MLTQQIEPAEAVCKWGIQDLQQTTFYLCPNHLWHFSSSLWFFKIWLSPPVFNTWFAFSSDQYHYETSNLRQGNAIKLSYKTNRYEKYSVTVSVVESSNKIEKQFKKMSLKDLSSKKPLSVIFIINDNNNLNWSFKK